MVVVKSDKDNRYLQSRLVTHDGLTRVCSPSQAGRPAGTPYHVQAARCARRAARLGQQRLACCASAAEGKAKSNSKPNLRAGVLCPGNAGAAARAPGRRVRRGRRGRDRRGAVLPGPAAVLRARRRPPRQAPAAGRPGRRLPPPALRPGARAPAGGAAPAAGGRAPAPPRLRLP